MKNSKIAVLNLNPGIDRVMYLNEPLKCGCLNRSNECVLGQGSKAANFSIMLKRLCVDVEYFSFTGGVFGEICNSFIEKENIKTHYVETQGGVRLNFKVVDSNGCYTEVNEKGAFVEYEELEKLLLLVEKQDFDIIVLCGSLPSGVEGSAYGKIIKRIRQHNENIRFILDCDGEALKQGVKAVPYLIKPNRAELCDLGQVLVTDLKTKEDAFALCRQLYHKYGVNILCTLDCDGVIYVGAEGDFSQNSIEVEAKGFNGAGDTCLAAFVFARLYMNYEIPKSLEYCVCAAAAKVELRGSIIPQKERIDELYKIYKI